MSQGGPPRHQIQILEPVLAKTDTMFDGYDVLDSAFLLFDERDLHWLDESLLATTVSQAMTAM